MEMDFGGVVEKVVTRDEYPLSKARKTLENEVIAILGYGIQGTAQALNLRDNGVTVVVGQRMGKSYDRALNDGWKPGIDLFSVEDASKRGTIISFLFADVNQKKEWPNIRSCLKKGDALCFSHGFSITYSSQTGIVPPSNVDVILVAPKGSGRNVRRNFVSGSGINSSYAVHQDFTRRALERVTAMGIAIGSGYLFPTTFEKEVYSDLTGERGVLMGALEGIMEAQYNCLRKHDHSPSEAFNETVEELTQSLIRLVDENGMDWMYANCSPTAQRGALDWRHRFRKAVEPVFEDLYQKVVSGEETRIVLETAHREKLEKELEEMRDSELWRAGASVRSLRPKKQD